MAETIPTSGSSFFLHYEKTAQEKIKRKGWSHPLDNLLKPKSRTIFCGNRR
jgi:hypothetical protein